MLDNDKLVNTAASYKTASKKRFDEALKELLQLAWRYKDAMTDGRFSFDADPAMYEEALRICRELSDGCLQDAKNMLVAFVEEYLDNIDANTAWEHILESDEEGILTRFDMSGSHLLDLLNIWVSAAIANDFTMNYTRISVLRYLNNPFASGLFGAWGKDVFKWGRGYSKNIADQLSVIGQNAIISAARYAEWMDSRANGATYYIRRRGSTYDCMVCDERCGYRIPIEQPFEYLHSRCCCWPEYYYD